MFFHVDPWPKLTRSEVDRPIVMPVFKATGDQPAIGTFTNLVRSAFFRGGGGGGEDVSVWNGMLISSSLRMEAPYVSLGHFGGQMYLV